MTVDSLKFAQGGAIWRAWADAAPGKWWALAMAAILLISLKGAGGLGVSLGDADDAARLLQVREFMGGSGWFDTFTGRMGSDPGMLSHWSRLIDLPIAGLLYILQVFMPASAAETVVRAVWPFITLAPLAYAVIWAAHQRGGATAAAISALLIVVAPLALYQFTLGRIDHHGVMIAATVSAAALLFARPNSIAAWPLAGALCAFALAIGYEALAPVAILSGCVAVWGLAVRTAAKPAQLFSAAFASAFAGLFLATTAPSRWFDVHCDAMSLNMVVLAFAGAGGLIVVLGPGARWRLAAKLAVIVAVLAAGAAAFGLIEPKCLAGPMGQLPPELKTVWLNMVAESRSIVRDLLSGNFRESAGLLVYFGVAIAAAWRLARNSLAPHDLFLFTVVAGFSALACWQYKYMSYASFVCVLPIALAISRLGRVGDFGAPTVRFAAAVAVSQSVLLMASSQVHQAIGAQAAVSADGRAAADTCSETKPISDLADLAPGLISAHIDIGAFIPVLTHHRALSAPYHRIPDAILANHRILESRDDAEALRILTEQRVDYVVLCDGLDRPFSDRPKRQGTLRVRLITGDAPAFLSRVPLANPKSIFSVWKVAR